MAANIIGGYPNVCHGLVNLDFVSAGINSDNTALIVRMGNPLKSYRPGQLINTITRFEVGAGYYFIPLTDIDLTGIVAPPYPDTGAGNAILLEGGDPVLVQ